MPDTDLVLVKELKAKNGSKIGHITLNSEETLNSLTLSMVDIIHSQLSAVSYTHLTLPTICSV